MSNSKVEDTKSKSEGMIDRISKTLKRSKQSKLEKPKSQGSFKGLFTLKRKKNKKCRVKGLRRIPETGSQSNPIKKCPSYHAEIEKDDDSLGSSVADSNDVGDEYSREDNTGGLTKKETETRSSQGPSFSFIGKAFLFDSENLEVAKLAPEKLTIGGRRVKEKKRSFDRTKKRSSFIENKILLEDLPSI